MYLIKKYLKIFICARNMTEYPTVQSVRSVADPIPFRTGYELRPKIFLDPVPFRTGCKLPVRPKKKSGSKF